MAKNNLSLPVSSVPMAIIPFQLWTPLRTTRPRLHRVMGWIAVVGIFVGGISIVPLALNMDIPTWGKCGFITGGVMWLVSAAIAVISAVQKNFDRHRWFMLMTAALIFSSVTIRLVFPLYRQMGIPFETAYAIAGWSSWMINLGVFFAWQNQRKFRTLFESATKPT